MGRKSLFHPYTQDNIHPGFSIDCVVLSFYKKKLRVLLNKFDVSKYWQLPGGFMLKDENSDDAAKRILLQRTGLEKIYLRQFYLFSDPERTKIEQNTEYVKKDAIKGKYPEDTENWFLQRFVSLGYFAFVKYDSVELSFTKEDEARWFDIHSLPELYSDHQDIIETSLRTIRSLLPILPVGYQLLPDTFALSELRKLYEILLNKHIDRRNFQRKALASGLLVQLDKVGNSSPYNPPILYSFPEDIKKQTDFSSFLV